MATNYKQSDLLAAIYDSKIEANAASQIDQQGVVNFAVREVLRDLDLRSTKRLAPAIDVFDDVYDFSCPSDMKSQKIIDLVPQVNRSSNFEVNLVPAEEFDRRKAFEKGLVAFNDHDGLRKLRIAVLVDSQKLVVSSLDSLTAGGGTWSAIGDAQNVRVDSQNYVEGNGSLLWDIGTGASGSAGITNSSLNSFDISSYLLQGSIFVWVYIQTVTNLTSFALQIGNNRPPVLPTFTCYLITTTTTNEGNAFSPGWNLLRFDFASATIPVTTPDPTDIKYFRIYANSSPAITSSSNWRFDSIVIENGNLNQVLYYSKFGWQDSSTSAWKENSTAGGDHLNADTEEFNLFVLRGKMESDRRLRDWNAYTIDSTAYREAKSSYLDMYPSEAKLLTQTYYDLASTERDFDDVDIVQNENSSLT